jgi:uncharacterized membrane protein
MWFIYALIGAVGKSYSGFFRKKMTGDISATMYMWISFFIVTVILTPFMLPKLAVISGMFANSWLIILGAVASLMVATYLNLEALKLEELSYIAPLNAFVPVFTLLIAFIFLGEDPPKFGIIGILLIFAGAYIVNIRTAKMKWYEPLKHLITNSGARLSVGVAFGYAVNTVLLKQISNQGYDSISIMYATTLLGLALLMYKPFKERSELGHLFKSNKFIIFGAAISSFAGSFFHILAIAGTFASYAVGVRRFEVLFSVILGWKYLKESNIRNKLIGSGFMIAGTIAMLIS